MKKCKRSIAARKCRASKHQPQKVRPTRPTRPAPPAQTRWSAYFIPPRLRPKRPPPPPFAPCDKIAHTHTLACCTTDTVSWQYGFAYAYAQNRQKRHPGVCPRSDIATPMADACSRARQSNFKVHLLEWPRPQYSQTTLQRFLQGGTHGTRLFSRSQRCCAGHQLQP